VAEDFTCSGECGAKLPAGTDIPKGWTVARIEKFGETKVIVFYLYVCPSCTINVTKKQKALFENEVPT